MIGMRAPTVDINSLKIAIVHDWLVGYAGGEMVTEQILHMFPQADLFALVDFVPESNRGILVGRTPKTSFIQKLPFARTKYRTYLPFLPYATEQFDLSDYDLIISSNLAVTHGVLTSAEQLHLCYFNNTMIYAWDLYHHYLKVGGLTKGLRSLIAKAVMHYIRIWDASTAHRADKLIANSAYMGRRLMKQYGRESTVIFPPVDVERFSLHPDKEDYFIVVARLVPFKRIDIVVDAFNRMPDRKLKIVGGGPDMETLSRRAGGNIEFVGQVPLDRVNDYVRLARALIQPSVEPFGISVIEAQATGTPIIAYRGAASPEIVKEGKTGVSFNRREPEALVDAVREFEGVEADFDPRVLRAHAEEFSIQRFRERFMDFVKAEAERHFSGAVGTDETRTLPVKRRWTSPELTAEDDGRE